MVDPLWYIIQQAPTIFSSVERAWRELCDKSELQTWRHGGKLLLFSISDEMLWTTTEIAGSRLVLIV